MDTVTAGHVVNWLFLVAANYVEFVGLKQAAWRKERWSESFVVWRLKAKVALS